MVNRRDAEQPIEFNEDETEQLPPEEEEEFESGYIPEIDNTPLRIETQARRLVTQPYDLNIRTIVSQVDDDSLIVQPPYQRGYIWDDKRASRLVESLIMNIPIPACYFSEEEDGTNTVIDGQQRIHSIWRFVKKEFTLRGLTTITEANGKAFSDLPERDQRLILGRSLRCVVITRESHPELKFEIFERLNTGAVQLSDQEIRNAIYRGEFNQLIKTLAEKPLWLQVLSKQKLDKRMRDDELVLRFFAVHDRYQQYQAPLRAFLNSYMSSKTNSENQSLSLNESARLTTLFEQTVNKVLVVFQDHAFRLYNRTWERQVNRALFDAVMLVFSNLPEHSLRNQRSAIESSLINLCSDPNFLKVVSRSTADRNSFMTRIAMFNAELMQLGLDSNVALV